MTVRCEKHPQLRIYDLGIRFTGGTAEVTDVAKLDALRGMTGYGFIFEGAEPDVQAIGATGGASQRAALRRQGVTAFSIGDLSESYGGGTTLVDRFPFMAVDKVGRLLSRWLRGGYRIC